MEETNYLITNTEGNSVNRRGRPVKQISKIFCPPPTSIVAQFLRKCAAHKRVILSSQAKSLLEPVETLVDIRLHTRFTSHDTRDEEGSQETLAEHDKLQMKDCPSSKDKYICRQKSKITRYKKPADGLHSCDYQNCTYTTKLSCNLLKHKRTHTNEKPFLCDRCSFRTNFVNSLKTHKRIHTLERPYCCEHCGHRSNSISNLKKHRLHKHSN